MSQTNSSHCRAKPRSTKNVTNSEYVGKSSNAFINYVSQFREASYNNFLY